MLPIGKGDMQVAETGIGYIRKLLMKITEYGGVAKNSAGCSICQVWPKISEDSKDLLADCRWCFAWEWYWVRVFTMTDDQGEWTDLSIVWERFK